MVIVYEDIETPVSRNLGSAVDVSEEGKQTPKYLVEVIALKQSGLQLAEKHIE